MPASTFYKLILATMAFLTLAACDADLARDAEPDADAQSILRLPMKLQTLTSDRRIAPERLFAEITLRYDGIEESAIASRDLATGTWPARFRLPAGHAYDIELTWFDTEDGGRLDLVNFNRSFPATFTSGPINFVFDDFDFDGYDADSDGETNLAEREAGTSPLVANDSNEAFRLCLDGTAVSVESLCADELFAQLQLPDSPVSLTAAPNNSASGSIAVANGGTDTLDLSIESDGTWLTITGASSNISLPPGGSLMVQVGGFCAGNIELLSGELQFASNGGNQTVPVLLDCRGPILSIASPDIQLNAEIVNGIGQADSTSVEIGNNGNDPLEYTISSDADWLCASTGAVSNCTTNPITGTLAASQNSVITITAFCAATTQLRAGNLTVDSNGGSTVLPVRLLCSQAPEPQLLIEPGEFNLAAEFGASASAQLQVGNTGNAPLNYELGSNAEWLQIQNSQGSVNAGQNTVAQLLGTCTEDTENQSTTVNVISNGGNTAIPVNLSCTAAPAPALTVQTPAISVQAELNNSADTGITLANSGNAALDFSLSATAGWLALTPTSNQLQAGESTTIALQAACDSTEGQRQATVDINSNAGPAQVSVTLQCDAPPQPQISLLSVAQALTAEQNQSATGGIEISNTGDAELNYTVSATEDWLALASTNGTLIASGNTTIPYTAACGDIVELRSAAINIHSDGGNERIPVSLDCSATPTAVLSVNPGELALSAQQGESANSDLAISNTGTALMTYSVVGSAPWLSFDTTSGSLEPGLNSILSISASCAAAVESRTAEILIEGNGGSSTVAVLLNCTAIPAAILSVQTGNLELTAQQAQQATSTLQFSNIGDAELTYTISTSAAWLQVQSTSGTLASNDDASLPVTASCTDTVEIRTAEILIEGNGGSSTVAVQLNCTAIPAAVLSVQTGNLELTAQQSQQATSTLQFSNIGDAELAYTISTSAAWLQVQSTSGTLASNDNASIAFTASCTDVVETRSGTITVGGNGGDSTLSVTLQCTETPQPVLSITPANLTLNAQIDQTANGEIEISNAGSAALQYSHSTSTSWLTVDSQNTSLNPGESIALSVSAQCDDRTETRNGQINIDSNAGSESIQVMLVCEDLRVPQIAVDTSPILFTAIANGNVMDFADEQSLVIGNTGDAPLNFSVIFEPSWLRYGQSPNSTVSPNSTQLIVLRAECDSTAETLTGQIVINWENGAETIPVSLVCEGPAGASVEELVVDGTGVIPVEESEHVFIWGRPTAVQIIGSELLSVETIELEGGECSIESTQMELIEATCTVTDPLRRGNYSSLSVFGPDTADTTSAEIFAVATFVQGSGYHRVDDVAPAAAEVGLTTEFTITGVFNYDNPAENLNVFLSNDTVTEPCNYNLDGQEVLIVSCETTSPEFNLLSVVSTDGVEVENGTTAITTYEFIDDFSVDNTVWELDDTDTDQSVGSHEFVDGNLLVNVVTTGDLPGSQHYGFRASGLYDSMTIVASLESGSSVTGNNRARVGMSTSMYSEIDTSSGEYRDVSFYLFSELRGTGSRLIAFGAFLESSAEGDSDYPILEGEHFHIFEGVVPVEGASNEMSISLDRANHTVTFRVDDQQESFDINTPIFPPDDPFYRVSASTRNGPGTSVAKFSEIRTDNSTFTISDDTSSLLYSASDNNRPGRVVTVEDEELKLESVSTGPSINAKLRVVQRESKYIGAQMRLSSESTAVAGGSSAARVGGTFYYANANPDTSNDLDNVFAVTQLILRDDGITEAQYCAWQSTDDNFSSAISLTNPDDPGGCQVFETPISFDQNYQIATWLNIDSKRLYFSIGDEQHFMPIVGPIAVVERNDVSIRTRTRGNGSRTVAFADNLLLSIQ